MPKIDTKVGDTIKIIKMQGERLYTGREGKIIFIDDEGQLHGDWGGLAVAPEADEFKVIKKGNDKKGE